MTASQGNTPGKRTIMFKQLTICLTACLWGCTTTDVQTSAPTSDAQLYTCHSVATCDGVDQTAEHTLCAQASTDDVTLGDRAAEDWVSAWKVTCYADQGVVDGNEFSPTCVGPDGQAQTFGCDAWCEPTYKACE